MIAQLSDCHLYADPHKVGYAKINPLKSLERCVVSAAKKQCDWFIFTGDLSGDFSLQSYQHLYDVVDAFLPWDKVLFIPGNHDHKPRMAQVLPKRCLVANSIVSYGAVDLVFLDAEFDGNCARVTLPALQDLLASCRESVAVYCYMHHHPVDSHSWMDKHELTNRQQVIQLLNDSGREIHLFHGHIHHASNKEIGHIKVFSCPSTCWQWQMQADFAIANEQPGYRIMDTMNGVSSVIRVC